MGGGPRRLRRACARPIDSILANARGGFKRRAGGRQSLRAAAIDRHAAARRGCYGRQAGRVGSPGPAGSGRWRRRFLPRRQQAPQADVSRYELGVDLEHFLKVGHRAGGVTQEFS